MKSNFYCIGLLFLCLALVLPNRVSAVGYTLTLNANGPGSVAKNPTNTIHPPGVVVTISASPDAGAYFTGWSGDTNGFVTTLNITMNGNYVITGNFQAFPTYPLTLATNGQGSIVLSPAGGNYTSNTTVTATATPASGWVFNGWTGSAAGSTNPLAFTMNSSNSLTGNFAQLPTFDVEPVGVTNALGSTVSFFAHANGSAPLAYQWQFNGSPLVSDTNNSLVFTNATLSKTGNYRVIATNNFGSVTSSVAVLVLTNNFSNPVNVCDEPSLRAAIANGGWIQFGCNGIITLANTIIISNTVILDASYVSTTISGGNAVRIFRVTSTGSLTISNLTLANGCNVWLTNLYPSNPTDTSAVPADGGAIYNGGGTVRLISCLFTNNRVIGAGLARGGAIFNNGGILFAADSIFTGGIAFGGATNQFFIGNPFNYFYLGAGCGGAIFNTNGMATFLNCSFINNLSTNYAVGVASGGGVYSVGSTIAFSNCLFSSNTAIGGVTLANGQGGSPVESLGGAIYTAGGILSANRCRWHNNVAKGGAGGISSTSASGSGGAIFCTTNAIMALDENSFFGNQALGGSGARYGIAYPIGVGGGIFNAGNATFNNCLIFSNLSMGSSGRLFSGDGKFAGDSMGAGIFNVGLAKLTNCTICLNSCVGGYAAEGGFPSTGIDGKALGGGIFNSNGASLNLLNCTIASNLCVSGHTDFFTTIPNVAVGAQIANSNGVVHLHNSLLAYSGTNGNAYGPLTDDGYNISSDGSAGFSSGSSYNFTDPKLGSLADNGGPTLTMSPLADSPAIDFGDAVNAPVSDQRGLLRPFGDGVDMGAVEFGSTNLAPAPLNFALTGSAPNLILNFTASPPFTYHLQSSTNLISWQDVETIGSLSSPSNITRSITPQGIVKKFYRVWYQ